MTSFGTTCLLPYTHDAALGCPPTLWPIHEPVEGVAAVVGVGQRSLKTLGELGTGRIGDILEIGRVLSFNPSRNDTRVTERIN